MNRETTGRMARKDIKFHLFHKRTHRTVCPTFYNSQTSDNGKLRLRARDASVGENEVLNSTG